MIFSSPWFRERPTPRLRRREGVEHLHRDRGEGVRVVVDLDRVHVCLLLFPVEALDVVLRAFVEVNRFLVQQDWRGELIHLADDLGSRMRGVDDHDVVRRDAAEVDLVGRKSLPAPEPPTSRTRSRTILFEQLE